MEKFVKDSLEAAKECVFVIRSLIDAFMLGFFISDPELRVAMISLAFATLGCGSFVQKNKRIRHAIFYVSTAIELLFLIKLARIFLF